jgi:hypothetical protein
VLIPNSPTGKLAVVGIFPGTDDLFILMIGAAIQSLICGRNHRNSYIRVF